MITTGLGGGGRSKVEYHLTGAGFTPVLTCLLVPCTALAAQALQAALSAELMDFWGITPRRYCNRSIGAAATVVGGGILV